LAPRGILIEGYLMNFAKVLQVGIFLCISGTIAACGSLTSDSGNQNTQSISQQSNSDSTSESDEFESLELRGNSKKQLVKVSKKRKPTPVSIHNQPKGGDVKGPAQAVTASAPTAPQPPVPMGVRRISAGLFSHNGGVFFSNGKDAFCGLTSPSHLAACGMSNLPVTHIGNLPTGMRKDAVCACASDKQPVGTFIVGGGIFFSNGNDAFCGISSPAQLKACGMANLPHRKADRLPTGMRHDKICGCGT
jgi:hypothetical protein